ncbi:MULTISPECIES: ABC transporter permease [Pseudarthrobacter]|uniref:Aldouronate transport system permease protein n=1 Tax=Pseudarthrobacter niigatensis TaxID=369935 RepID=A0AAJ1SPR9_9MICC|nr:MULTISPECIES: ABC transporter permease subunit [Pseudarthrobacter]MDQ0144609.1 putative aldouronate transport system permease protein [Pseudarthrobacter niigatensis]MDQ0265255.1 putative aldouronate transport system permease protein [Pseudarthrobacter niigatensis]
MSRILARSTPAAPPAPPTNANHRTPLPLHLKKVARSWQLYVLLAPALIYIAVFKYWPMYGVQIAFRNYNPVDGFTGSPWVGLQHFIRFVNSYQFGQVVGNTFWIAVLGLVVAFPIPIVLALLVNQLQSERFKKFTQTVLYSPAFISTVVVVGMMFVLLSPRSGLVNNAIQLAGGEPIFFMGSSEWFRPIYVISDVWQNAGFSMIVYLAALSGIDPALHDAAKVDGASKLQRIRHIDLPGIMPVVTVLFILAIGNLLNVGFEKALLMQTNLNLPASEIIQTYVYHAGLQQAQFSYSAAIGLFNSVLNLVLLLTFNWVARRANQATLW